MAETSGGRDGVRRGAKADETYRVGWRMAGLGWEFLSHVLAGLLIGWGVDWYFGVRPWGIAGGAVAGLLVGTLHFIRQAMRLNRSLGPVERPKEGWKVVEDPADGADAGTGDEARAPGTPPVDPNRRSGPGSSRGGRSGPPA